MGRYMDIQTEAFLSELADRLRLPTSKVMSIYQLNMRGIDAFAIKALIGGKESDIKKVINAIRSR
jgi:hypothetical protein